MMDILTLKEYTEKKKNSIANLFHKLMMRTEGIIIHAFDYKDHDRILTIFTPEYGIQKLYFKGGLSKKRRGAASPLTRSEFQCRIKNSSLLTCTEISPINSFSGIRKEFESLEAACRMLAAIRKTQQSGKPAPDLYALLNRFLQAMENTLQPANLAASFILKLLRHDGYLGNIDFCSACQCPLTSLAVLEGEPFCKKHAPYERSIFFESDEKEVLAALLDSRSLLEITRLSLSGSMKNRISSLLESIL